MTRRNLTLIAIVLSMFIGLTGCLDGGNVDNYKNNLGVMIREDSGAIPGLALGTGSRIFAVSNASALNLTEGACLIADFEIDYDNQPSSKYYTVTVTDYLEIDRYPLTTNEELTATNYPDTIVNIPYLGTSPNYYGMVFIQSYHYARTQKQDYAYQLSYSPDSIYTTVEGNNEKTVYKLYLQAKEKIEETGSTKLDAYIFGAFDLRQLILTHGRISTVNSVNYKTLDFDLYYQSSTSEEGKPIFKKANSTPIEAPLYQ